VWYSYSCREHFSSWKRISCCTPSLNIKFYTVYFWLQYGTLSVSVLSQLVNWLSLASWLDTRLTTASSWPRICGWCVGETQMMAEKWQMVFSLWRSEIDLNVTFYLKARSAALGSIYKCSQFWKWA
jgi:hypothetical protein